MNKFAKVITLMKHLLGLDLDAIHRRILVKSATRKLKALGAEIINEDVDGLAIRVRINDRYALFKTDLTQPSAEIKRVDGRNEHHGRFGDVNLIWEIS